MATNVTTMIDAEKIAARVRELGAEITREYAGRNLVLVCVLKGSFVFLADTGLTIAHLLELLRTRKPASVKVCSLLHKPARTRVQVPIDFLGFTIEDKFVVGYGLDWAEKYRNLPFIGLVESA